MKPSDFPDSNQTWKIAGEVGTDLPVQNYGYQLLSLWRLSWRERLSALVFGRVWLGVMGGSQPPVWLSCERDAHDCRRSLRSFLSSLRWMGRKGS